MKALILLSLLTLAPFYALAQALGDPKLEARAVALGEELRCVVCQSESINSSQASMASDMRLLVRDKISAGWSDQKILDFLRVRYGDFILLRPPVQNNTYLLWASPLIFLILATGLVATLFRKRKER